MRFIIIAVVALAAGAGFGFVGGNLSTQAQIDSLHSTIAGLESSAAMMQDELEARDATIASQSSQVSTYEGRISALEEEHSELEAEKSLLEAKWMGAESRAQEYQDQTAVLNSELGAARTRLDRVLGISITQHYTWDYQWQSWYWDLPIALSAYVEYMERPRPFQSSSFVALATDPGDDAYIDSMVQGLNEFALQQGFTEAQKLGFIVAFVQNMSYTVDNVTTPYDEYPRYPIETLFDRGGDCEDTSILVAALLDRMGYDVALLILENAQHAAVGVSAPTNYGQYYDYNGKRYYFLETTNAGWGIGSIPTSITDTTAYIYPLGG